VTQRLVSAVVPSFNHERFVASAIRSLVGQTYPSLELVVSDDGSSDGTLAQVEVLLPELQARFQRVEIVANPHRGIGENLRTCLERARGELVYMLDSDDVADSRAIEQLLPLIAPLEVALAVGDNSFIGPDGEECFPARNGHDFRSFLGFHTAGRDFNPERDFGTYRSLIGGNYVPNGWLLKKSAVESVGGYDTGFLIDDWELLLRLVKRYKLAFTPEVLLRYRLHDQNTVRLQHRRMFLDTARILIRERGFSTVTGALDAWESHARLVLPGLTAEDIESGPFLAQLLPGLSMNDRDAVRTLTTAMAQGPRAEPNSSASPRILPAGSGGERIHLIAACWNDVRILPFFFRHYDSFVDRYVIYDDGSTDGSLDLLTAHPRVEVRRFEWTHPESFVLSERDLYNHAWKECRGVADWVLVVDLDEHLHAPALGELLSMYRSQGVSVVPALGFEMVTEDFPSSDEKLADTRTRGAPSVPMSKLAAFNPLDITEINHAPGGHASAPTGRVVAPATDVVRLLHYKYLGFDYVQARDQALRGRLRPVDLEQRWGEHWNASAEDLRSTIERYESAAVDAIVPGSESPRVSWNLPRLLDAASIENLEAARVSVEQELARVRDEVTRERTAFTQLAADRARDAEQAREAFAAAHEESNREREHWSRERAALVDSAESYERVAKALGEAVQDATLRVAALEASRTWRWTRPARDLATIVSRLLHRPPPS
jgi:glycosyltransferase involved in cell wall biosynthesis